MLIIQTKHQFARRASISLRTLERLLAAGAGPTLTKISERRDGVEEHDGDKWLASRRIPAPGKAA